MRWCVRLESQASFPISWPKSAPAITRDDSHQRHTAPKSVCTRVSFLSFPEVCGLPTFTFVSYFTLPFRLAISRSMCFATPLANQKLSKATLVVILRYSGKHSSVPDSCQQTQLLRSGLRWGHTNSLRIMFLKNLLQSHITWLLLLYKNSVADSSSHLRCISVQVFRAGKAFASVPMRKKGSE